MERRVVQDIIVPAQEGRALEVRAGQVLRIYLIEAPQLGDAAFFNLHNFKEQFHVGQSWALNNFAGTGNGHSFQHFYSNPPFENVMLSLVEDTSKVHFGNMSGRCSIRMNELRGLERPRSCQENVAEAVASYGIKGEDIHDMFNLFMNVELDGDWAFTIKPPIARAGDYVELRAEMDILAALSACPGYSNPLGMRVFEA